jgi:hypothetical protein
MSTLKSKTKSAARPFVDTDQLKLSTDTDGTNKIIAFNITYKGVTQKFPVKNFNIFDAWQKLEVFVIKQNKK